MAEAMTDEYLKYVRNEIEHYDRYEPPGPDTWAEMAGNLLEEVDRLRKELARIDNNARVALSDGGRDMAAETCVDPVYALCCMLIGLRGEVDRLRSEKATPCSTP